MHPIFYHKQWNLIFITNNASNFFYKQWNEAGAENEV